MTADLRIIRIGSTQDRVTGVYVNRNSGFGVDKKVKATSLFPVIEDYIAKVNYD